MRTAYLLTGDLDVARDRVAAAVAATSGSGSADAEDAVLGHVVRATVRAERDSPAATPEPDGVGDLRGRLWSALRGLPAESRAVVVLERYAERDPVTVARLLHRRPAAVLITADEAYAALAAALRPGDDDGDADLGAETAAVLAARARDVPLDPAPYERVRPLLRRRRRRTGLVTAGVVALLVVLVAGYAVAVRQPDRPRASGGLLSWPARGPLAADATLVREIRARVHGGHLLYLADTPGGRVGLVAGRYAKGLVSLVVLQGPAGAPIAALEATQEGSYRVTARVVAWADPQRAGSPLVVLGPSDARTVAVSTAATPGAGDVRRDPRRYRLRGGVLATTAPAATYTMIRVTVAGQAGVLYDGPVTGIDRASFYPGTDPPRPALRYGDAIDEQAWRSAAAELAATYQVPYRDLRVRWRWTERDGPHTAWVAAVYQLPGGAEVLQVRWWSRDLGGGTAVNRYVRGRPIRSYGLPVAWRADDLVGVFYPGHPRHRVTVIMPGGDVRRLRTDRHGYLQVPMAGRGDPEVIVRRPPAFDVSIPVRSAFDLDPLDVGRARQGA